MKGKPKVLSTHGSLLGYKKYLSQNKHFPYTLYDSLTFKSSAKKADAVIVSSKLEYEDAIEFGISKNKLHIIPMGINIDDYNENSAMHDHKKMNILFVGRIARVRRVEILLKAVEKLSIPFHLTLVGGEERTSSLTRLGYINELKELCEELNITDQVTFVGPVAHNDISKWYKKSDIFVYPSLYENFGQPILEAAASGLPIISTPVGIANEIIVDGETGFLVTDDHQELANRISQLQDTNLRLKMGDTLRKKVQKLYGWQGIIDQYIGLYQSL